MNARNWLDSQVLEIESAVHDTAPLVRICQFSGSMHFQFDMSPEGARAMAAEMIAKADEAEAMALQQVAA